MILKLITAIVLQFVVFVALFTATASVGHETAIRRRKFIGFLFLLSVAASIATICVIFI